MNFERFALPSANLGFAEKVTLDELAALRKLADVWLHASAPRISEAIDEGVPQEVYDDEEGA